jgi:hypothetical protein
MRGDAISYLEEQQKIDWEREKRSASKSNYSLAEFRTSYFSLEEKFYAGKTPSKAMDAAVQAVYQMILKQKKRKGLCHAIQTTVRELEQREELTEVER